jgi:hypothetical protein
MEDAEYWFPELPLPEVKTITAVIKEVITTSWDLSLYYEAMGLDFEDAGE